MDTIFVDFNVNLQRRFHLILNILLDKNKLKIVLLDEGFLGAKKKRGLPRFKIQYFVID